MCAATVCDPEGRRIMSLVDEVRLRRILEIMLDEDEFLGPYFHGDNGAGIGASHQTGWTGTVALLFLLGGHLHSEVGATAGVA